MPCRKPAAVEQVMAHAERGEQAAVLKDVADLAAMRRHRHATGRIGQHMPVDRHPGLLRPQQTGDRIDHCRLSGAGAAEQRGDAGVAAEGDIEREVALPVSDRHLQAHAALTRRLAKPARSSEIISAAIEMATEIRSEEHTSELQSLMRLSYAVF